jgi:hypothetical protein
LKLRNNNTYEARAEFLLLRERKRGETKVVEEGDNKGRRAVMLRPIKFQCVLDLDFSWTF